MNAIQKLSKRLAVPPEPPPGGAQPLRGPRPRPMERPDAWRYALQGSRRSPR